MLGTVKRNFLAAVSHLAQVPVDALLVGRSLGRLRSRIITLLVWLLGGLGRIARKRGVVQAVRYSLETKAATADDHPKKPPDVSALVPKDERPSRPVFPHIDVNATELWRHRLDERERTHQILRSKLLSLGLTGTGWVGGLLGIGHGSCPAARNVQPELCNTSSDPLPGSLGRPSNCPTGGEPPRKNRDKPDLRLVG
jgi:hypothetical protein